MSVEVGQLELLPTEILSAAYWNGDAWIPIGGELEAGGNFRFQVTHFSLYTVTKWRLPLVPLETEHFRIRTLELNADLDLLGDRLERAWTLIVDELGFLEPIQTLEGSKVSVWVMDLRDAAGEVDSLLIAELLYDYVSYNIYIDPYLNGVAEVATPAHELFHLIQVNSYLHPHEKQDLEPFLWWMEATATWIGSRFTDLTEEHPPGAEHGRLAVHAWSEAGVSVGDRSLVSRSSYHPYLLGEFTEYVEGLYPAFARRTWSRIGTGMDPLQAVREVANEEREELLWLYANYLQGAYFGEIPHQERGEPRSVEAQLNDQREYLALASSESIEPLAAYLATFSASEPLTGVRFVNDLQLRDHDARGIVKLLRRIGARWDSIAEADVGAGALVSFAEEVAIGDLGILIVNGSANVALPVNSVEFLISSESRDEASSEDNAGTQLPGGIQVIGWSDEFGDPTHEAEDALSSEDEFDDPGSDTGDASAEDDEAGSQSRVGNLPFVIDWSSPFPGTEEEDSGETDRRVAAEHAAAMDAAVYSQSTRITADAVAGYQVIGDGRMLVYCSAVSGAVLQSSLPSGQWHEVVPRLDGTPISATFSSSGTSVAVTTANDEGERSVFSMSLLSGRCDLLPAGLSMPRWSRDEQRLLYLMGNAFEISRSDGTSWERTEMGGSVYPRQLGWRTESSVWNVAPGGSFYGGELWITELGQGGQPGEVISDVFDLAVAWRQDGEAVMYSGCRDDQYICSKDKSYVWESPFDGTSYLHGRALPVPLDATRSAWIDDRTIVGVVPACHMPVGGLSWDTSSGDSIWKVTLTDDEISGEPLFFADSGSLLEIRSESLQVSVEGAVYYADNADGCIYGLNIPTALAPAPPSSWREETTDLELVLEAVPTGDSESGQVYQLSWRPASGSSGDLVYSSRVDPSNPQWTAWRSESNVRMALADGKYVLEAIASDSRGKLSSVFRLEFDARSENPLVRYLGSERDTFYPAHALLKQAFGNSRPLRSDEFDEFVDLLHVALAGEELDCDAVVATRFPEFYVEYSETEFSKRRLDTDFQSKCQQIQEELEQVLSTRIVVRSSASISE